MWFWIIAGIVLAVLLGIYGLSCLMFHFMFYRPKRSTKIPAYYKDSPHYKASQKGLAVMKTVPCEDVYLTSRDGLKLHAYLYKGVEGSKKFVVGIHGYRSYSRPEYGPYFEFYRSLGYNMLLPDDRAHAPSEGTYIGFGVLDRLDCVDWCKYLVERFGPDTEIRLHGVSMGSATVLAASGEADLPKQVSGIVADCGYTRAWDAIAHELRAAVHVPVYPFLPICEKICKHRAGFDFHEYAPVDQVRKASVPILFVHGQRDAMVPPEMAPELYAACASRKRLLLVPDAPHGASIAIDPAAYHKAIHEFFEI